MTSDVPFVQVNAVQLYETGHDGIWTIFMYFRRAKRHSIAISEPQKGINILILFIRH